MDSSGINWNAPKALLNGQAALIAAQHTEKADSVLYNKSSKDEIDAIIEYANSDTANDDAAANKKIIAPARQMPVIQEGSEEAFVHELANEKGINTFAEDYRTNYIFSLKQLGWANIDRLYTDPRTQQVTLVTKIENNKQFKEVYITLIIPGNSMYLPGYERKDGTYSFTHGDTELPELPVGEPAAILVTAYKNDEPFYAIQKFTIAARQEITIVPEETTAEKLKSALKQL